MGDGSMARCVARIDEEKLNDVPERTYKYGCTGYADAENGGGSGLEYMQRSEPLNHRPYTSEVGSRGIQIQHLPESYQGYRQGFRHLRCHDQAFLYDMVPMYPRYRFLPDHRTVRHKLPDHEV